jgi:hypothetical protein
MKETRHASYRRCGSGRHAHAPPEIPEALTRTAGRANGLTSLSCEQMIDDRWRIPAKRPTGEERATTPYPRRNKMTV